MPPSSTVTPHANPNKSSFAVCLTSFNAHKEKQLRCRSSLGLKRMQDCSWRIMLVSGEACRSTSWDLGQSSHEGPQACVEWGTCECLNDRSGFNKVTLQSNWLRVNFSARTLDLPSMRVRQPLCLLCVQFPWRQHYRCHAPEIRLKTVLKGRTSTNVTDSVVHLTGVLTDDVSDV